MVQPQSIRGFSILLLAAAAIDLINNLASFMGDRVDFATAIWVRLVISIFPVLIALLLWWLITRRRSMIAKWVMVVLVAFGTATCVATFLRGDPLIRTWTFHIVLLSEALKIAAVLLLFRTDARAWLARS